MITFANDGSTVLAIIEPTVQRPRPAPADCGGYHLACLIGAGLVVVAIGVAVTTMRPGRR